MRGLVVRSTHFSVGIVLLCGVCAAHKATTRIEEESDRYLVHATFAAASRAPESRARAAATAALLHHARYTGRPSHEKTGVVAVLERFATRMYGPVHALVEGMQCIARPSTSSNGFVFAVPKAALAGVKPLSWPRLKQEYLEHLRRVGTSSVLEAWVAIELDARAPEESYTAWLAACGWPGVARSATAAREPLLAAFIAEDLWQSRPVQAGYEDAFQHIAAVLREDPEHAAARALLHETLRALGLARCVPLAQALYPRVTAQRPNYMRLLHSWLPPEERHLLAGAGIITTAFTVPASWMSVWNQYRTTHPAAAVCVRSGGVTNLHASVSTARSAAWFQAGIQAYSRTAYNLQEARTAFLHALDCEPANAMAYMYAGACFAYAGQPEVALPFLFAAVRLAPHSGEAHAHLATCYYFLNSDATHVALLRCQRALALDPSNQWIQTKVQHYAAP